MIFDKNSKLFSKAYGAFGTLWWFWVGAKIISETPKYKPAYTFDCKKLIIYDRNIFYRKISKIGDIVIQGSEIKKFDTFKLVDIGKKTISTFGCKIESLSYTQKILFYILGIEVYDYLKNLRFGNEIVAESSAYNTWEQNILPDQLKQYRDFLGLSDNDIPEVEKAYDQILQTGRYP